MTDGVQGPAKAGYSAGGKIPLPSGSTIKSSKDTYLCVFYGQFRSISVNIQNIDLRELCARHMGDRSP